jgi:hypothetical protein
MTTLDGTYPVRPFHPDGFFVTVQVDGQHPRVAALVCHQFDIVTLSLVDYVVNSLTGEQILSRRVGN